MIAALKKIISVASVLAVAGALVWLMLAHDPFAVANDALDSAFNATPKWTQVENVYRDPRTQDVSHGNDPAASLAVLAAYWSQHPHASKLMFMGNSQMMTISLAPGEQPPTSPEKTYVDLVGEQLAGSDELVYRMAAPGL